MIKNKPTTLNLAQYWLHLNTYYVGEKIHLHEDRFRKHPCSQKHGKQQTPYMNLTLALLLVNLCSASY